MFSCAKKLTTPVLLYWVLVLVLDLYLNTIIVEYWYLYWWTSGTDTGTGTCEKVLAAKTKSFLL